MGSIQEHHVVTQVPGPLTKRAIEKLDTVFDARAVHLVADYDKSDGN